MSFGTKFMKLRIASLILFTILLSACNFTLAEDVTPPPDYVPPTPAPTLVLVPPQKPNAANGQAIYFEKCAPCHGETGLGDGPQGIQLGVTVPAFALPEVARQASPAQWYTTITRGKIERFMPPFVSLTDQERWDVVAYIMSLHTSADEIQKGKELFEANCSECPTDYYKDLGNMSELSTVELARIIRLGNEEMSAFGENFSDDQMWATAEYLRSLTYDTSPPLQPTPVQASETQVSSESLAPPTTSDGTPLSPASPADGTAPPEVQNEAVNEVPEGFGSVSGTVENRTGGRLPSELQVVLHGYEHDFQNPNAGTQEVLTVEGIVAPDGSFVFEKVEMPESRIFLAEVVHEGVGFNSDFAVVETGQGAMTLPPIILYDITEDTSELTIDEVDIFIDPGTDGRYEVLAIYSFRNTGDKAILVKMGDAQEIPFIKYPLGAQGLGYQAMQDSAPFIGTDDGFAMPPSETVYGLLAFSSIPMEEKTSIMQSLAVPVTLMRIFVPEGMQLEGDFLTDEGVQDVQGTPYQSYRAGNLQASDAITFNVSGSPNAATGEEAAAPSSNYALLVGAAFLGIALILGGVWMYLRDRRGTEETENEEEDEAEEEFESADDVTDAIIALDDLYRAKKISNEAYQKRRAELKDILRDMM
jgi:mono/diheme cytochrome c family protein